MTVAADASVVIATLDRPDALECCLSALLHMEAVPKEIIVVDQSAGDDTRRIVELHQSQHPNLVYLHHHRRGMSVAQNIGFARATCPIVCITDDDCIPQADWVKTILAVFDSPGAPDVVTGRILPLPPDGERTRPVASRTSTVRAEFQGKTVPWNIGSGNNMAIKREWLERIGGCDERLGPGAPGKGAADMDLFYRLVRAGARVRYEPDSVVFHQRHTRAERLARRVPYGYGVGACVSIYLRQGDIYALYLFTHWMVLRVQKIMRATSRRHLITIYEQLLMIVGTFRGLVFGLSVGED